MSPVAADWASADRAAGEPAAVDAPPADVEVVGADEVVEAGGGVDAWFEEDEDDEPQPVATAEDASTVATAESLWIEFMGRRLAI
jgi:hypothetical protein